MNVTCPDCNSVFRVDPAKVPDAGVRARCSVCGGVLEVARVPAAEHQPAVAAAPAYEVAAYEVAYAAETESRADAAAEASERSPGVSGAESTAPPRAARAADVGVAGSVPAQVAPETAPHGRPARPFNPYLSNTPELRARRLARALVSDLVAYNPQKREEGLRDGTLRQLFREEIRKSWEEYVEQVGAHVAESTPHFQDALNDVLAGGRRVF